MSVGYALFSIAKDVNQDMSASNAGFRCLYAAEMIGLAVPTFVALAPAIGLLVFMAFIGVIYTVGEIATGGGDLSAGQLFFFAALVPLAAAAVIAIWNFASLSGSHLFGKNIRTPGHRRQFRTGLRSSALPMAVYIILPNKFPPEANWYWLVYTSGIPLLIPVVHLAFATRYRNHDACDSRPVQGLQDQEKTTD